MKPLKLTLSAFGPYPEREQVDFARFGTAPLFLIHGRTGAGKSSILDALCFALYGVASGSERQIVQLRSQWAHEDRLTEVTLDFALGDAHYRIRRRPAQKRPRRRGEGMVEIAAAAHLWKRTPEMSDEEDGTLIAEGVRDVTEAIEDLTGLTAQQFRQVIVLPQGEFRKLISASSGERAAILDSLFDTWIFNRLQEALKARAAALAERRGRIEAERKGVLDSLQLSAEMSDEQALAFIDSSIAEIEKNREKIAADQQRLHTTLAAAQTCLDALSDHRRAQIACEKAEETLKAAEAAAQTAEKAWQAALARDEERLALQKRRDLLRERLDDVSRLHEALHKKKETEQTLAGLEKALGSAREKHEQTAAELRKIEEALMALSASAERKQRLQQERETLQKAMAQRERLKGLKERIAQAETAYEAAQAGVEQARARLKAAEEHYNALQARLRASHAALLAAQLRPGEPCPVCGSREHPHPARVDGAGEGAPDDAAMARAEAAVTEARNAFEAAQEAAREAERQREVLKAERNSILDILLLSELTDDALARQLQRIAADLTKAEEDIARRDALTAQQPRLQATLSDLEQHIEEKQKEERAALNQKAALQAQIAEIEARLPEDMRDLARLQAEIARIEREIARLEQQRAAAEVAWTRAKGVLDAARGRLQQAKEEHTRTEKALLMARQAGRDAQDADLAALMTFDMKQPQTLPAAERALAAHIETVRTTLKELQQEDGRLQERLKMFEDRRDALRRLQQEDAAIKAEHERVHALAELAAGDNPLKTSLQRYVLAVLFDEILQAANQRLLVMSERRYRLFRRRTVEDRRRAGGLELDVHDAWTGESRPVQTLSGGEGFLAALALALGMADVVQARSGGMRMQTLFIDEGFGALDSEALDKALLTLESLHGEGRLIGIISHVSELRERIPARLEIIRGPHGSRIRHHAP
ncbi:AAA family ATPase [Thermopetrobacter sp. TC1]|uniref:AAA family ATPase n=1 Tax=Thermopetrobacter sp. TC1 TaxID=1495045 RepID=UPI000571C36B|nr:SMC family ATPase [Thermopetrobacter sp. TC1]